MQKILYLDYLDGSKELKEKKKLENPTFVTLGAIYKNASKIKITYPITGPSSFNFEDYDKENRKWMPDAVDEVIIPYRATKNNLMPLLDYAIFFNSPNKKNYVFSANLTQALSETRIEKDTSLITEDRGFYFEMPNVKEHDTELLGVYGYTMGLNGKFLLALQLVVCHKEVHRMISVSFSLGNSGLISEQFEEYAQGNATEEFFGKSSLAYDSTSMIRTVLNGVIYIFNNCEEMNEVMNQFATKKSKQEAEKRIYTEKPFVELGSNFQYLRLVQVGEVDVRGHYRWQPSGVGRSELRLTYVKPHHRMIKRNL